MNYLVWWIMGIIMGGRGPFCRATELGVSTSAYQVEGAFEEGGRTWSVWDTFSHTPDKIRDGSTGDEATDHYHHWREDVEFVESLGATAYRFSFSWTRLLPTGRPDHINQEGVRFYNHLIDDLVSKNITPLATLFHWDSPQTLQDEYGGWQDDRMIDDIVGYADVCFGLFGDRVKFWMTLNEPLTFVNLGYGNGYHAPGLSVANPYAVVHRCIVAHARIYKMFHSKYPHQDGKISIALNSDFVRPLDPSRQEDIWAAERGLLWRMGIYADPLFFGDYPADIRQRGGDRVPDFLEDVSGTLDFFSLNHYTTLDATSSYNQQYSFFSDAQTTETAPPASIPTIASWLHVFPEGIYGMIGWLERRYGLKEKKIPLVISESGVATSPSQSDDDLRITYLQGYIEQAMKAQNEWGVVIPYYCVWSLLDNWEWSEGYTQAFGLISVDFQSSNKTRTPKKSFYWLKDSFSQLIKGDGGRRHLRHTLP